MRIARVLTELALVTTGTSVGGVPPAHADEICVGVTVTGVVAAATGDQCWDSMGQPTFGYDTHVPLGVLGDVYVHARLPV